MKKLKHFWQALEGVVGQETVSAEWRAALGPEWGWGRGLLRPTDALASFYPKLSADPESPEPYRVVCHDEDADDYVGVCPAGSEWVTLRRADLVLLTLDHRALAKAIASATGIVPDHAEVGELAFTYRVGTRDPLGAGEAWVYMCFPPEPEDLSNALVRLALLHDKPFVLLTPTDKVWWGIPEALRGQGAVMAMSEVLGVGSDGSLTAAAAIVPPGPSNGPAGAGGEPVFRRDGRTWVLAYDGKTIHPPDSKGLAYIAYLLARPGQHTHAAEAMAAVTGDAGLAAVAGGAADPVLDRRAWAEAREAFMGLEAELAEAKAGNDAAAEARVRRELASLGAQMSKAGGKGGRDRDLDTARQNVRRAVGNAIERALTRLQNEHEPLWRHLDGSKTRGMILVYDPPAPVPWQL